MPNTPIYTFPVPALSAQADGPDGFQDLADRVERQMTTLRSAGVEHYDETTRALNTTLTSCHSWDFAVSCIGWAEVEAVITLGTADDDTGTYNMAGDVAIWMGGVSVRSYRYHSKNRSRLIQLTMLGTAALTAAITTMNVQVRCNKESAGSAISYLASELVLRQYGAPAIG